MKRDIDHLMKERGLGAAIVLQGEHMSPTFRYLTGPRAHLKGIVVWRPGQKPYLVHHAMERDSAAATGFALGDYGSLGWMKLLEDEGSQIKATARLIQKVLDTLGVRGRVLVDGVVQLGWYYHVLNHLREMKPDLEIEEDQDPGLFELARSTKDPDEVKTVRTVASVCERAYARIREIIQGARLEGKKLRDGEGPVTIGRLRREVRRVFFEGDLVEPHGHRTIRQDERVEEGYVHGLGHGIGLEVHERPRLSAASNPDLILPGSLFTVEPGLYYPSRGLGVRIEDVIYAHHDGSFENLTHVPYELEIAPA